VRFLLMLSSAAAVALASPAQAQTVIGFDDSTGIVTDQYPPAIFSSIAGAQVTSIRNSDGTTPPNIICSGPITGIDCLQPIFVDFTVPVNELTFWAIQANAVGVTAQFRVFEDGALSATVDLVSTGGDPHNEFVDLSSFINVTRLEIVNILDDPVDENGIAFDTFSFTADLDRDKDGLLDDWEINGVPYVSGDGFDLRFILPGADAYHKDLYVEVDAMTGIGLTSAAVTMLENAFDQAPLTNPDGIDGVTLHVLRDEGNLPHVPVWQTDGCWPLDFDAVRSAWYGNAGERAVSDPVALLEAKAKAYRYCVAADTSGPKIIGGCGQTPGDNFVIFIKNYTDEQQAAVFMHELGHNLSLKHGGANSINGKPNYPSVMNYVMSYRASWNTRFWRLDYSRADAGNFTQLDEIALDEQAGIGTPTGIYKDTYMPYGVNVDLGSGNIVRAFKYVRLNGSATDFGDLLGTGFQDGSFDARVIQDLNYVTSDIVAPSGIPSTPSPFKVMLPHDDWANVDLPPRSTLGAGAPAMSFPTDEIGPEAIAWIEANFPMPPIPCLADLNGDGIADQGDIQSFITLFLVQDLAVDFNGDGIIDLGDIGAFVDLFLAGC
jgi:hypothetical protein